MRVSMLAVAVSAVLAPTASLGQSGVIEINQACATGPGCVAGDGPGFPVTLDGIAGSNFRLTSELVVPNANTTAILITAPSSAPAINLDMNYFAIRGPTVCALTVAPPSVSVNCSAGGAGYGVDGNAVIRRGSIIGMGASGARVVFGEEVAASHNAGIGLQVPSCRDCSAFLNGGDGLLATQGGGAFEHVSAIANGGHGLNAVPLGSPSGINVRSGSFSLNGGDGVRIAANGSVSEVSAELNENAGISATGIGARIADNAIGFNFGGSIVCSARCLVRANTANDLLLTADSGYRDNMVSTSTVAAGVNLGGNLCSAGICP